MSKMIVAQRYARAFLQSNEGDLESLKKGSEVLHSVLRILEIPDAKAVLLSPVMPVDLKRGLLHYALEQCQATPLVRSFIDTVIDSERVEALPAISAEIDRMVDELSGTAHATVTSATALGDDERQEIADQLNRLTGKSVTVESLVDPAVMGGFVARIGNLLIDLSIKTKLDAIVKSAAV